MKRIFIVGAARSGTTLLQSLLAKSSDIYTFPESHFFRRTIPKKRLERIGYRIKEEQINYIRSFLDTLGKTYIYEKYQANPWSIQKWTKYLINIIDKMAISEEKEIWLEKTPMHLYYIGLIEKYINDCFFIHIVREPISNIAALYSASKKYPDAFKQNTLEKAFERYRKDISLTDKYINHKNNFLVYYEELADNPERVVNRLFKKLDIDANNISSGKSNITENIIMKNELWKEENRGKIEIKNKILERISPQEVEMLTKKISSLNYNILKYYETKDYFPPRI